MGTFTESSWDLYSTIESLTDQIREVLEVPASSGKMAQDLPLAETYGESLDAFKSYVAGLNARLFNNVLDASNAFLDSALESDPGFVTCRLR